MNDNRKNSHSPNEMEQIRRGLEEFLQQEMTDSAVDVQDIVVDAQDAAVRGEGPQLFTIGEEDEAEKEIDVIDMGRSNKSNRSQRSRSYEEDWDSRKPKKGGSQARSPQVRDRQAHSPKTSSHQAHSSQARGTAVSQNRRSNSGGANGGKRRKKKSGFARFLITVAVIFVVLAAGLYYMVGQVYADMNYSPIDSLTKAPMKKDGVVNILLIGNDSRENGEDGRSDAMILLSISNKTKKIYMTSLLRDMYVDIPGHDGNRLNAAYSFGGAELLMETVEKNLDITVNRYVLVNFEAFANLVDAVGGVNLELSAEEIELVNGYLWEYNILTERPEGTDYMDTTVAGLVHLNGPQALAYSRNRYIGTDFGRTERQRKVLTEVIRGMPKGLMTNPKELADGLLPNLTTNLTQGECYQLSLMAPKMVTYDIEQASIPLQGTYKDAKIRGMAVLEVDFDANRKYLHRILFEPGEDSEE